jgi:hypothetical protein
MDKEDGRKKVFLIVNYLRVHHCRGVKVWIGANIDRIERVTSYVHDPRCNYAA